MMECVGIPTRGIVVTILGFCPILSFSAGKKTPTSPQEAVRTAGSRAEKNLIGSSRTALPDGRTLVTGGTDSGGLENTAFLEGPQPGVRIQAPGSLKHSRAFHSGTLLPNGTVLFSEGPGG